MGYERNSRDRNRDTDMDYGQDYGTGRDYTYSSARDYAAAGWRERDEGRDRGYGSEGRSYYGARDRDDDSYGAGRYDQRPYGGYGRSQQGQSYGYGREGGSTGSGDYGRDRGFSSYGGQRGDRDYGDYGRGQGPSSGYRQSWGRGLGYRDQEQGYGSERDRGYRTGRGGYDRDERGFFERAGDEVRSWFGDEEAERRREADQRWYDQQQRASDRDYSSWRDSQISAFDRDYDEYRQENRSKFHNEFGQWRNQRQTQRDSLNQVDEHMEVVGSDGQHVGTVDKVRGDKIVLTKNDQDAGGHHHSIPSRWIQSVDDKVTISKTADEAKREWKDVERNSAMFGNDTQAQSSARNAYDEDGASGSSTNLNRSFSGTYRS